MARRKARIPQGKKIQPAAMSMQFVIPPIEGANTFHTIDLSQCASLLNRKFFRQGLNWHVAGFTLLSQPNSSGNFQLLTQQKNWISSNSWHKGFATWQRMNNDALEEVESVRPKFLDFKIYLDSIHHSDGYGENLLPYVAQGIAAQVATAGEWQSSKMVIPDTTDPAGGIENREIIWTGANYPGVGASGLGAVSLIEGYAASRGLPDIRDPNAPLDAADADGPVPENWMSATFNEGTQQDDRVIDDMITENNLAPYPFENDGTHVDTMYPGGANQLTGLEFLSGTSVTATTVSGVNYLPGGSIPSGLLRVYSDVTTADQTASACSLVVHMIPGHHRGYAATPMQDM